MMNNLRLTVSSVLVLSLLGISACDKSNSPENVVRFETELSPKNELPPVAGNADGEAEVKIDQANNKLSWEIEYEDLSGIVTDAHFHGPAMAGEKAGVALDIKGDLSNPIRGEATITAAQTADLLAGKWYVNLHTAANPDGEIRGQLAPRK